MIRFRYGLLMIGRYFVSGWKLWRWDNDAAVTGRATRVHLW